MSKISWCVNIEQRTPFETIMLEVFEDEADALLFAATWMQGRAGHQRSKRRWTVMQGDGPDNSLIVWKRTD